MLLLLPLREIPNVASSGSTNLGTALPRVLHKVRSTYYTSIPCCPSVLDLKLYPNTRPARGDSSWTPSLTNPLETMSGKL